MAQGVLGSRIGAEVRKEDGGVMFYIVGGRAKIERCNLSTGCACVVKLEKVFLTRQVLVKHGGD